MGLCYDANRSELQAVIHEEINRLPTVYRTAVILCGLEGRPLIWAARELRCPVRRLERRFSQALECLRLRLARRGYVVPPANWDCEALRDLGAIVPKSLIESTVAAATGGSGPAGGCGSRCRDLETRWAGRSPITEECLPPGYGQPQGGSRTR
jgi:hypothetical protein